MLVPNHFPSVCGISNLPSSGFWDRFYAMQRLSGKIHFILLTLVLINNASISCAQSKGSVNPEKDSNTDNPKEFKTLAETLRESAIKNPVVVTESDDSSGIPLTPEEKVKKSFYEKPEFKLQEKIKDRDLALEATSVIVRAEVISVTDEGAVVTVEFWKNAKHSQEPDRVYKRPVFIYGIPKNLVDGSIWKGKVYVTGNYRYVTTLGNTATVLGFATTKQLAVEH